MDDSDSKFRRAVIGAHQRSNVGAFEAIGAIALELHRFRSHIATIFSAEFANVYRGTLLGVFWNFALPLVPVSVYILLVNLKVFPRFEGLQPAVYIGYNVTIWMLFAGMITRPIQVVKNRTKDAMKTSIPLSAAIGSSFTQLIFDTVVRIVLVTILVIIYGPIPHATALLAVLPLAFGVLLFLSIGIMLAIFNMIYPDVARVTGILLQYGIFVSGIIFPISTLGPLAVLEDYNPFNVFVSASRDMLFFEELAPSLPLLYWSGFGVLFSLISIRFFYVMEHRIREVI